MARYIDADKIDYTVTVVGQAEYAGYRAIAFESDIDDLPTADVVPKHEVDYARQCGYESGIRTGARKAFEEIDELIKGYANSHFDAADLVVRLYMLKKKYTEGEDEKIH